MVVGTPGKAKVRSKKAKGKSKSGEEWKRDFEVFRLVDFMGAII